MTRGTWRHKSCLDMDLVVQKIQWRGPRYIKLRVLYLNRHNGYFFDHTPETIKINYKDYKNWSKV